MVKIGEISIGHSGKILEILNKNRSWLSYLFRENLDNRLDSMIHSYIISDAYTFLGYANVNYRNEKDDPLIKGIDLVNRS